MEKRNAAQQKGSGMKTIKDQIKRIIVVMLTTSLLLIGIISSVLNYITMHQTLEKSMSETAFVAAEQVNYRLADITNPVEVIGSIARLTSDSVEPEQKQKLLDGYVEHYDWESLHITDDKGDVINSTLSVGDTEYFQKAIAGNVAISEPMYSEEAGKWVVVAAAPLWKSGLIDTEVAGIVYAEIDAIVFAELVAEIKISENGAAYIIDNEGNTIAHANFTLVETSSNTIQDAKTDSGLRQLAELEQNMVEGEYGFGKYSYNGTTKYMAYAPVGINGWSIAITAPTSDFNGITILGVVITVVLLIVTLVSATIVANKFGTRIGGAVSVCAQRLKLLAEGDLTTEVPVVDTEDETKILAESTAEIVGTQQTIIGDVRYLLNELAEGNFDVRSRIGQEAYVGAYMALLEAMRALRDDMTETLRSIVDASAQVEAGSVQLANASQDLAEGATEQAGAVDELLDTVTGVTEQVEKNNEAADMAHEKINQISKEADQSEKMMEELTLEMKNIEDTSAEINKIIAEIEEIASQTNLLALNASIEAARAGEAGRGFAVVADQIGKLAADSAQSAVNTKNLIIKSLQEISNGNDITARTTTALGEVIEGIKILADASQETSELSREQAETMAQVRSGIEQIADVVQNNSAAAQETSATSEELLAQSENLKAMVEQFKLLDE